MNTKILDFIQDKEVIYVNEVIGCSHRWQAKMIRDGLRQCGVDYKRMKVRTNCAICGANMPIRISEFLKQKNHYCNKHKQRDGFKGSKNPLCTKIEIKCTNCHKAYQIPLHKLNHKNSFGDTHNFCCQQCYWDYRSQYYRKDKSPVYRRNFSEEEREKRKIQMIINSRSAKRFDSGIQISVNKILDEHNIDYEREHIIGYYAIDNFLPAFNLMIEVMGKYWHVDPSVYDGVTRKLSQQQYEWIHRDKLKKSYILNHTGVNILYLWEDTINQDIDLCKEIILSYVKNDGKLFNYHFFNYSIVNDKLMINKNLILPYQDQDKKIYKNKIS